jgi:hypothetical protein
MKSVIYNKNNKKTKERCTKILSAHVFQMCSAPSEGPNQTKSFPVPSGNDESGPKIMDNVQHNTYTCCDMMPESCNLSICWAGLH